MAEELLGVAQGIDGAPMEVGQFQNVTQLYYLLPTGSGVIDIEIEHTESPSIDNEGDFKGVGEGGLIGVPPMR